jgi:isochorismate pyruvate lyase
MMTLKHPKDIGSMAELRGQIDQLDHDLIRLLAVRQRHVDRAAQLKPAEGLPARIETRVNAVVDNVRSIAEREGFDAQTAADMWHLMIESMIAREEQAMSQGDQA